VTVIAVNGTTIRKTPPPPLRRRYNIAAGNAIPGRGETSIAPQTATTIAIEIEITSVGLVVALLLLIAIASLILLLIRRLNGRGERMVGTMAGGEVPVVVAVVMVLVIEGTRVIFLFRFVFNLCGSLGFFIVIWEVSAEL